MAPARRVRDPSCEGVSVELLWRERDRVDLLTGVGRGASTSQGIQDLCTGQFSAPQSRLYLGHRKAGSRPGHLPCRLLSVQDGGNR